MIRTAPNSRAANRPLMNASMNDALFRPREAEAALHQPRPAPARHHAPALAGRVPAPPPHLHAEIEALRAQVMQLNQVLDSAADYAIITLDMAGGITRWNNGAGRITGYVAAEVLGRSGDIIFTSEDRAEGRFALELCRALEDGRATNERWHLRRDGTRFWASGLMMPILDAAGRPEGFLNILRDRTEARAEAERRELLMAEMNHRIKNTFATIQAVAAQTGRNAASIKDFQKAFTARLRVLSRSHDVLIRGDWVDAPLRTIVEAALEPYRGNPDPVTLDGTAVMLAAPIVVAMSLVFHELATNAAKYGALSVPGGRVAVTWTVIPARPGRHQVQITWREQDGPPVTPPTSRGFGSQILEHGIPTGGTVDLDYRPEGLECRIVLPLGTPPNKMDTLSQETPPTQ